MPDLFDLLPRMPVQVAEQWLEAWKQGAALQQAALSALMGSKDPRELRARWLSELARASESFMRSPDFLRMSRNGLDAMIAFTRLSAEVWRPVRAIARLR